MRSWKQDEALSKLPITKPIFLIDKAIGNVTALNYIDAPKVLDASHMYISHKRAY
jgi:hypothetical protein